MRKEIERKAWCTLGVLLNKSSRINHLMLANCGELQPLGTLFNRGTD